MTIKSIENIILTYLINYQPVRISLFGSYARREEKIESDIDLLVQFKKTPSLFELIKMENELSHKLGIKVDLFTEGTITNSKIKKNIKKDLYTIYNA